MKKNPVWKTYWKFENIWRICSLCLCVDYSELSHYSSCHVKTIEIIFCSLSSFLLQMSYWFGIYGLLSTICIVFSMISTPCGQYAGSKARRTLHDQLLQSIVHKSIYFCQVAPFGRLMNRFSLDMAVIDKVKWYSLFLLTTINFDGTYFIDRAVPILFVCSLSFPMNIENCCNQSTASSIHIVMLLFDSIEFNHYTLVYCADHSYLWRLLSYTKTISLFIEVFDQKTLESTWEYP